MLCLVVAGVYLAIWPKHLPATGWPRRVLRWFHSFVWVLLAAACFVRAGWGDHGNAPAKGLALAGLVVYLIFLITLITQRK